MAARKKLELKQLCLCRKIINMLSKFKAAQATSSFFIFLYVQYPLRTLVIMALHLISPLWLLIKLVFSPSILNDVHLNFYTNMLSSFCAVLFCFLAFSMSCENQILGAHFTRRLFFNKSKSPK